MSSKYPLHIGLMFTISKVCIILHLLCLCGNREYPGSFQNKSISSSFKWVPEWSERDAFLKWTSIDLSSKLSLTYGGNVNYYKSVHHPIPKLWLWEQGTSCQFSKQISKLSFQWSVQIYSVLGQTQGERRPFLENARSGTTLWDYPQEHLAAIRDEEISPFVKFKISYPSFVFY